MKKVIAAIIVLAIMTSVICVSLAESTVETIINAGTAQSFLDEAVPEEDINAILQAGLAAPSAINQQPWYMVAITDKDVMTSIAGSSSFGKPADMPAAGGDMPAPSGDMPAAGGDMPAPGGDMPAFGGQSGAAKAALGDSPLAIVIYKSNDTKSPDASLDCGLAAQNMYIAAVSLGYGAKIVSSPTMSLNGDKHDELCELLGVDKSMEAVAVLLVGKVENTDSVSSASVRADMSEKVSVIK